MDIVDALLGGIMFLCIMLMVPVTLALIVNDRKAKKLTKRLHAINYIRARKKQPENNRETN